MDRDVWFRARRGAVALSILVGCATPLAAKVKKPTPAADGPEVTFVGFSADGTTGMVYVNLSKMTRVTRVDGSGQVRFIMAGTAVVGENNMRPLLTAEFGTPIRQVRIVPDKDGAILEVNVAGKPSVTHKLIQGEGSARLSVTAVPAASPRSGAT